MFLQKDSWKDAHLSFESSSSTFSNNNKKSIVLPSKNAERNTKKTQKITIMQKLPFFAKTLMMVLLLVSFQKNVFKNIKQ